MNGRAPLGERFAAEVAEQPAIWRALARAPESGDLRAVFRDGPVLLLGSGSSFFVAELAARMFRCNGYAAFALAATDVAANRPPFTPASIVAFSQSGRSADVLAALDGWPRVRCIAVTNDPSSPLARRAHGTIALGAGNERAVPATKSVTAMAAVVLLAAAASEDAARASLVVAADALEDWLGGEDPELVRAVPALASASSFIVAGSGDGIPVAGEIALKCKESTYRHAEGVAAGEFRHGGVALLDAARALVVLAGADDGAQRTLTAAAVRAGAVTVALGAPAPDRAPRIGPDVPPAYTVLGWIAAGQRLALELGRFLGVDGDAPRNITKVIG